MLRPKFYITITNDSGKSIEFTAINYFEINEGYEQLTDTAKVILPRKVTQSGLEIFTGANPIFKRKDKIKIEAGYFPNRETIFEGFISFVSANIPIELECENYMFLFKQFKMTYPKASSANANITLSQLINQVFTEGGTKLSDVTFRVNVDSDIDLGQFRASNATPAQIFQKLKDVYGIYCRMVGTVLVVGLASDATDTKVQSFKMEEVCINSNELQYIRSEDVQVRVKVVSMLKDGTKLEAESGDTNGEQRTYFVYNVTSQTDLQKMADERVKPLKYTGFRGAFETLGEPYTRVGDYAKITSTVIPERNGSYLVSGVKRFGGVTQGYKQTLELEAKV